METGDFVRRTWHQRVGVISDITMNAARHLARTRHDTSTTDRTMDLLFEMTSTRGIVIYSPVAPVTMAVGILKRL